jgi:putative SOS response-associated peptidase YedK
LSILDRILSAATVIRAVCGRYTNTADPGALEQRFGTPIPFTDGSRRYNIAPTDRILAIVQGRDGGHVARSLRWGLIPAWATDAKSAYKMINARSETADTKPAYRKLLSDSRRRALLPADGFFEWLRSEDPKQPRQPFHFTVDGGQAFALAGLWTPAKLDGEWIDTATILTTCANGVVGRLHDRMPVILPDRAAELAWLDARLDGAAAKALCVPLPDARVRATPANPAVNKTSRDAVEGPELLRAAPAALA